MRTWILKEEENKLRLEAIKSRVQRSLSDKRENLSSGQTRERLNHIFATHQDE